MVNIKPLVVIVMRWLFNSHVEQNDCLSACALIGLCHPILEPSCLKWQLMMDVLLPSRISMCSNWKTSFWNIYFFKFMNQKYLLILPIIHAIMCGATDFRSTWVTIYSHIIAVGDCTPQEDWWRHLMCAGFPMSTCWCSKTVSLPECACIVLCVICCLEKQSRHLLDL